MTRQQALKEAQRRWGKRAVIRAGEAITSEDRRVRAAQELHEVRQQREALEAERAARLKALDWLQTMNAEIQGLKDRAMKLSGEAGRYKFSVGSLDHILGAFFVQGQGDTWEDAFRQVDQLRKGAR